jgi:hypothetical protein
MVRQLQTAQRAAASQALENLLVTDVYGGGFSVTFTTSVPSTGSVIYGTKPGALTSEALDDRDVGRKHEIKSIVHRVTISGLPGGSTCYFEPEISGRPQPGANRAPYAQSVPALRTFPPMPRDASGKVLLQNGDWPAPNTVLIIARWKNTDGSQSGALSVFDKAAGAEPRNYDMLVGPVLNRSASQYFPIIAGKSVLVVSAEGDLRGRLAVAGPVSVPLAPRVTLVPDLHLASR